MKRTGWIYYEEWANALSRGGATKKLALRIKETMSEGVPIGKIAENILKVKMTGDDAKAEKKDALEKDMIKRKRADEEEEAEPKKGGMPWFLILSILVLVVVIGVVGFMAYKYWKRRQEEMQTVHQSALSVVPEPESVEVQAREPVSEQQKRAIQSQLGQALHQAPVARPSVPAQQAIA
jgi:cytoskeletal protein RodZ